jgi:hypothetical protein
MTTPTNGDTVTIAWTAARAEGGELRILTGQVDESMPEPEISERIEKRKAAEGE